MIETARSLRSFKPLGSGHVGRSEAALAPAFVPVSRRPQDHIVGCFNFFCITLYNEHCDELRSTLAALCESIRKFGERQPSRRVRNTICVIADGAGKVHEGVWTLIRQIGLAAVPVVHAGDDVVSYLGTADAQTFLARLRNGRVPADEPPDDSLTVLICVKRRNAGKLQSHEVFFAGLCQWAQPRYCYQIDTGTHVAPDAVGHMVAFLETYPQVGALAPQVMPHVPRYGGTFLVEWQYFDFAFSRAVSWPLEVASGHLSVLPGQVSAFRWKALDEKNPASVNGSPVQCYLRGLSTTSTLERVMFLAEDRVLGTELILGRTDWRLEYAPQAKALTDHCADFGELFRQRRRWINSALACRLWLLGRLPSLALREDRGAVRKATFCTASVVQTVLGFRDLLAPAIVLTLLVSVLPYAIDAGPPLRRLCASLFIGGSMLEGAMALLETSLRPESMLRLIRRLRSVLGIAAAISYAALIPMMPWPSALLLLAPAATLVPMMLALDRDGFPALFKQQFSPLVGWSMLSAITTYALFNLCDISWGTKGLLRTTVDSGVKARLRRIRTIAFSGWVVLNAAAAAASTATGSIFGTSLSAVVEIVACTDFLLAVGALVGLARAALRRRRGIGEKAGEVRPGRSHQWETRVSVRGETSGP
jgi:chitin synthase